MFTRVKPVANEKRQVGRPRLYSSPDEFDQKVLSYQEYCEEKKEPVTWTGLALYLGFSSRQSIDEYLAYPEFSDSVKRAKTFVEWHYELRLNGERPTGAIFALKNFGWKDKSDEEKAGSRDTLEDALSKLIDKLPN